jgi:hypothetical protein
MKQVHRPNPNGDDATKTRELLHAFLLDATSQGCKIVGCTGASFVIMGINVWASELVELDRKAASQMFRAIGDLYDPTANDTKRIRAEKRRRAAVDKLFAAVDLAMTEPAGSA